MKTAITIPDDLFDRAERLAEKLQKPRSQVYAQALREYLDRHDLQAVTEALNRVLETDDLRDPAAVTAGQEALRRAEW